MNYAVVPRSCLAERKLVVQQLIYVITTTLYKFVYRNSPDALDPSPRAAHVFFRINSIRSLWLPLRKSAILS